MRTSLFSLLAVGFLFKSANAKKFIKGVNMFQMEVVETRDNDTTTSPVCPPFAQKKGVGCPFNKTCVNQNANMFGGDRLPYVVMCRDLDRRLETWVQTEDGEFIYADKIQCDDQTVATDYDEHGEDGIWKAISEDGNFEEVIVYKHVKQFVCAQYSYCPQCFEMSLAGVDDCLDGEKCDVNAHASTDQGIFGHFDSVCEIYCESGIIFMEVDDGVVEVQSVQCNSTTHQWFGTNGGSIYHRKPETKVYCIAVEENM